jgi:hypothetical protein
MTTTKVNLEIALSRNFDKVTLGFIDEPISHENEDELIKGIRTRFKLLREEIELEFHNIQK